MIIFSERYGEFIPGKTSVGLRLELDTIVHGGFTAEIMALRVDAEDRISFSGFSFPYTILFVFGYSITLHLSKKLKKDIHDRGSHLFYSLTDSYRIRFQKDRNYIIISIHYAVAFVRQSLESSAQDVRAQWELHYPVFYFNRPKVTSREMMERISMLILPVAADLDDGFTRDQLARSVLMNFLLEFESSFQPIHLALIYFETFYLERDAFVSHALESKPISVLLASSGIRQISVFRKRLRQLYNLNIREFLTEIRMSAAKTLLNDPTLSIKEIAGQTGFSNPFYFSRVFTNYFGRSPKYFHAKRGS